MAVKPVTLPIEKNYPMEKSVMVFPDGGTVTCWRPILPPEELERRRKAFALAVRRIERDRAEYQRRKQLEEAKKKETDE